MEGSIFEGIDDKVSARKWEYEEGDQLGGSVLQIITGDGDYGPYSGYIIAPEAGSTESGLDGTISKDDPLIYYVNDDSAAARDLPPNRVQVGDVLVVKYFGEKEAKSGRTFKDFNIIVRPRAGAEAAAPAKSGNDDW